MGSKLSQTNKEGKSQEKKYNTDQKYNIEPNDLSLSQKTNEYTDKSSITTTTEYFENAMKRVPYKFEWKGEGKEVLLTGDFMDWKGKIFMNKNEKTGYYEAVLPLEKKKYNFKFIVDGNWVCSSQYPTNFDSHKNLNNFISLYNYSPPKELFENSKNERKTEDISNYNKIDNNNINQNNNKEENDKSQIISRKEDSRKKTYNCRYPLIHELNIIAPVVMWHYKPIFNLDYPSNQDLLTLDRVKNRAKYKSNETREKTLEYKEKNFFNENNTYKKIITCPHEKLMHFCTNLDDIKNLNINFFRLCTTTRTKHKFLTFIYYKPK